MGVSSERVKIEDFLLVTIIYPKINIMLLRQFFLGNNLLMCTRENADFPWQKPW